MKEAKKYLLNVMAINEAKREIEKCLSKYPEDANDGVTFTMIDPGHDGCRWSYKYPCGKIRLSNCH